MGAKARYYAPSPASTGLHLSQEEAIDYVGQNEKSKAREGDWTQRSRASGLSGKPVWFRATSCRTMAPRLLGASALRSSTLKLERLQEPRPLLTSACLSHDCQPPETRAEADSLPGRGAQRRQTQRQVQPRPAGRARADLLSRFKPEARAGECREFSPRIFKLPGLGAGFGLTKPAQPVQPTKGHPADRLGVLPLQPELFLFLQEVFLDPHPTHN